MKIAYVITRSDAVGGASVHVTDLAREFQARGDQVVVLTGGEGPVTEKLRRAGVPFRALEHLQREIDPGKDRRALDELIHALGSERPDVVSTHTAKAGWLGRAAAARLKLPAIYTPHGLPIGDRFGGGVKAALFTWAERYAARWARAIVCVSEAERDLALRKRIASPERLHVIHNGVHDAGPAARARPELDPVRIVSVARLEAPKDHATLFEALDGLVELDWSLDLVGDGPLEPALRREAARFGERVRFAGYVPDPAAALAAAQIFVLSSRSEGFPRSILEAMRAGLPVVASDVGGVREAVSDGRSGCLVEPRSALQLREALKSLISDRFLRQQMGAEGHHIYERRFRFDRMADRTAELYRAVSRR